MRKKSSHFIIIRAFAFFPDDLYYFIGSIHFFKMVHSEIAFSHLFNKYLLCAYYMPSSDLCVRDIAMNRTDKISHPHELYPLAVVIDYI